jgi:hypothetical protein
MSDEELQSPEPEDRLAPEMLDPSGAPQPVKPDDPVLRGIAQLGVIAVAVGGLMLPLFAEVGPTCGATRSAKLQWEQRQQEIDAAIQAEKNQHSPETTGNDGATRDRDGA